MCGCLYQRHPSGNVVQAVPVLQRHRGHGGLVLLGVALGVELQVCLVQVGRPDADPQAAPIVTQGPHS